MSYVQVTFRAGQSVNEEILIALLSDYGFEGFENGENELLGYISENQFSEETLDALLQSLFDPDVINYQFQSLPDKNWNEEWEKNYEPVYIANQVYIHSHFHPEDHKVPFEILLDPKMAFGTGHHATTYMMMEMMLDENFDSKTVLDFGCGTGILSILAQKMGAKQTIAIDNDEWAVNNTIENAAINEVKNIDSILGDDRQIPDQTFDFVLANVNKNIILKIVETLAFHTITDGYLYLSGLLADDENEIIQSTQKHQLELVQRKSKKEWICLKMLKLKA